MIEREAILAETIKILRAELASEKTAFWNRTEYWRNDALEAAAGIADRYGEPHIASDIRAMRDTNIRASNAGEVA